MKNEWMTCSVIWWRITAKSFWFFKFSLMIAQKKFQIPVKKCNISDYKWQFLLLLSTYPYLYVVICTYLLRHSFQFFIDVNCGSCEDNATSQQCRSTVVLSEKKLVLHKRFSKLDFACLFIFSPKRLLDTVDT